VPSSTNSGTEMLALLAILACSPDAPQRHEPGALPLDSATDSDPETDTDSDSDSDSDTDTDTDTDTSGPCPGDMAPVGQVCMDRYEAPNLEGALPLVMYSFDEAEDWCEARAKRLCLDSEWLAACEGEQGWSYPYGDTHQPGVCNDEETWRAYNQDELNHWPTEASEPEIESLEALLARAASLGSGAVAADEVLSLYQGEPSGDNCGCAGPARVYDLVGNVEEWTRRADGGSDSFHGALVGRYWAESRSCQSSVTTHGDSFRFYEIGFRCCMDPSP
jgi:formylglycine-generating enzyme required for sulfatase activity